MVGVYRMSIVRGDQEAIRDPAQIRAVIRQKSLCNSVQHIRKERGIVIKFHGSQKYTTDGISAAKMKDYCERAKVPCQTYANRSDIAGGSTLGNISTAHVSVSSVDIGLPQLAMHSAVETAGMMDTEYAVRALMEFWGE